MQRAKTTQEGSVLRSFSDVSTSEIAELALNAGKEAREKALDAGLEVRCTDEQGRKVIDKKLPDGTIKTTILDESKSDDE
ncbi:MAG: hypothetical protein KDI30_04500 [Pseudomonadales bacterium]|nr:hypothetical protein [Pseudomonadales bacterium]